MYANNTGKTVEELKTAMSRDNYLTAEASVEFGLADKVMAKR